jgi:tetratricopeptide (TPR) repeat protein
MLLNLANLYIDMARHESALPLLEEASQSLDFKTSPRLAWAARFNLLGCLCALNRAAEGDSWLPELRRSVVHLGNALDRFRFRWLEGQVHVALGRRGQAIVALKEARDHFASRGMLYDVALAGLELSALLLEEGRTAEVKSDARELAEYFGQLGVERELLVSLTLFCAAAEAERATAEQARSVLALLHRAAKQGVSMGPPEA